MEARLLQEGYDMTTFLSELLREPAHLPAFIWELEKISAACSQRIARLSKQTNVLMLDKLTAVSSLKTELAQRLRQLERLQSRISKLQARICKPFTEIEEGAAQYARLVEVGERLRDLQTCLAKARRGDRPAVEELAQSLPGVDIVQLESARLASSLPRSQSS